MFTEGMMFDRYKLIKLLGRGGFSEVWLAKDDKWTGLQVAIKIYAPGMGLDEDGVNMFIEEFKLVFDLTHTNLLRPTHFDCWERQPYLILPYCSQGSTFKYIKNHESMPEKECWQMIHDVASGLAYMHEKTPPLVHQDIKPDNILINDEGRYMITDFGISTRVRSTIRNGQSQEQSGGTMAYMGPECFSAKPKPIMAGDIWSMGAMMYELITGTPPFGNHGGVLQKNGADIPVIEGDYSQELKDIITKCLAKDTWERPSAGKIEELTYNHMHGIKNEVHAPEPITSVQTPPVGSVNKQSSKTKNTAQPQAVKGLTEPSIKKSKPIQSGKNNLLVYGGIAAAVVFIALAVAFISGGEEEKPVVTEVIQRPNYDSIAQVKIQEALDIKVGADTIIQNHPDEYTDASLYNNVEDIYRKALVKLDDALVDKDSLGDGVANTALRQQEAIKAALLAIYKNLDAGAEYVQEFRTRADAIKPLIEDLLENQSNETINEEDN